MKSIANSDNAWYADRDVLALSLPVLGVPQGMIIMNDHWTAANDGDYLIELNSNGHGGTIEGIAMGVATTTENGLEASVIPVANGFNVSLNLPNILKTAALSLHNIAGQSVWSTTREAAHGRISIVAETGPVPDGSTSFR